MISIVGRGARVAVLASGLTWLAACEAPKIAPPPGPVPGELASLKVTVEATARPFLPAALTVQGVDAQGLVVPGLSGEVSLTVDQGTLDTPSLSLADGAATAQVIITAPVAPLSLTATLGTLSTTVVVDLQPIAPVPGDAASLAASALPSLPYIARAQDYATDAPDLAGLSLSFNTATLVLTRDATLGALNALLERHGAGVVAFSPGAPGLTGPTLALRLPTAAHPAMFEAVGRLVAEPLVVVAYREHDDGQRQVATQSDLASWTWELEEQAQPAVDDNWSLERTRAPQAWNLAAAADVASGTDGADRRTVGIVEFGFTPHVDVDYQPLDPRFLLSSRAKDAAERIKDYDHALHVTGTIAGRRNTDADHRGIDGFNPLARPLAHVYGGSILWSLEGVLSKPDVPRVVNMSIGTHWAKAGINPNENQAVQDEVRGYALALINLLKSHEGRGLRVPLLVVAGGNDSGKPVLGNAIIDARWGSSATNAALAEGMPGILVVEAVGRKAGGGLERAGFSNRGGQVSAPGVDVLSAISDPANPDVPSTLFNLLSGTSMAAPAVSGLASFLASVEPRLTNDELVQAITRSAEPVAGAAPVIDAFAAVLAIDVALGNQRVLRSLLDVDDGTEDGNTRTQPFLGTVVLGDSGGAFGPKGDGRVDLRDFRRFRDALLLVEAGATTRLNGPVTHPKRDLNLDGLVESPEKENVFPRYDFNGDGQLSRTATAHVGGVIDDTLTDLQVLMHLFADVDVDVAELPDLVDSADVHINGSDSLGVGDIAAIELTFTTQAGTTVRVVRLDEMTPAAIVTLPARTLDVAMRYLSPGGAVLAQRSTQLEELLSGEDVTLLPPFPLPNAIAVSPGTVTLGPSQPQQFRATVDGVYRDDEVIWEVTGASAISASGLLVTSSVAGMYTVTATSKLDPTVKGTAALTIEVPTLVGRYYGTNVEWDYGSCNSCVPRDTRVIIAEDPMLGLTLQYCDAGSATLGWCTGQTNPWIIRYVLNTNGNNLSGLGTRFDGTYAGLLELTATVVGNRITGWAYWQMGCPGGCYDAFDVSR